MKKDGQKENIIVFGLGITGKASIKALLELGYFVSIYDNNLDQSEEFFEEIKSYKFNIINNMKEIAWDNYDLVLKSPGIKPSNEFLIEAEKHNLEIVSDLEVAYRLYGGDRFITVTGTNGKTTTSSLIAHILNFAGIKAKATGNIGEGILYDLLKDNHDYYIIEASSFQLHSVKEFRSMISVITNISEDHIDWHGSYENYKKDKFNIFKNLKDSDLFILNKDDDELKTIKSNARIEYFSLKEKSDAYYKDNKLYYYNSNSLGIIEDSNINLVGIHNIANVLASLLAIKEFNIENETIIEAIKRFNPIEHRIEYVDIINNVKYYNDSKGTNIDSTKVALKGFNNRVLLIAGGYDKGTTFDELFRDNTNINKLILFGENRDKIKSSADKFKINTVLVDDLEEAVKLSKTMKDIDTVLFSPASASWDMYKNFEERGNHFKKLVRE